MEPELDQFNRVEVATGARHIVNGAVIAYPTEACYGIGCDPANETAVARVATIKARPSGVGMILIADSVEKLLPYIALDHEGILDDALATWPGPFTWIFPATDQMPPGLRTVNNTVAVRVTAHQGSSELSRLAGCALVSTSANRHGQQPIGDYHTVKQCLGDELDFVVRGPLGDQQNPSRITDALTGKVLRAG